MSGTWNSSLSQQCGYQNLETDGDSGQGNGDAFDPLKVDPRWYDKKPLNDPFALFPLVYSMGADGAGGIATPADASLVMQLGAESVFVGSGIFKSEDPVSRAKAIVESVTYYNDAHKLAEISENLKSAMKGLDISEIHADQMMQERGW